jgi:cbb3-type cytochrome c oxidase subunit III
MKTKYWINPLLFLAVLTTSALIWFVPPRDVRQPNFEFAPEAQMDRSPAYDSFAANTNFPDGLTLRTPPTGTLARGYVPFRYQPTLQDALRAGLERTNPFPPTDTVHRERGTTVFSNYCQVCHGPLGQGNGPVTQGGFPPPASLLAERAVQMKDGQMFHVLTYGQGNMPAFSAQLSDDHGWNPKQPSVAARLSVEDRWSVILHVRMLQGPTTPTQGTSRFQEITKLFRANCAACHSENGSGSNVRALLPLIPDFSSQAWQMSQTEMALVNQIDYGSAPLMPAFRYKLTRDQVLGLAVYIRSLAGEKPAAAPPPPSHLTAKYLYGSFCYGCHDVNGKGIDAVRASMKDLPDFTEPTWQKSRKDADLSHSILEGKGLFMLPMKDKLGTVDVKDMVALVRGFEGGKQIIELETTKKEGPPIPPIPQDLLPEFVQAAKILGLLGSPGASGPLLVAADLVRGTSRPAEKEPDGRDAEDAARLRAGATVFRQFCMICHGPDGTGSLMRPAMPAIPDFTSEAFHKTHTDAQMRVSILDGKGAFPSVMPANRGRITEDQARDLVPYLRSFGPASFRPRPEVTDKEFEAEVLRLQRQLEEYRKEMQKLEKKP